MKKKQDMVLMEALTGELALIQEDQAEPAQEGRHQPLKWGQLGPVNLSWTVLKSGISWTEGCPKSFKEATGY